MKIEIGIGNKDRKEIANGLSRLLADTFTLYLKTHNFHWNVTGPMFQTLHLMFETQYNELWTAGDLIAERIRALGYPAPASYTEYGQLTAIKEDRGVPEAKKMVKLLLDGHETVGADGAIRVPDRRKGQRSADGRPPHRAHAGPREDGVDAAQPAGEVGAAQTRSARRAQSSIASSCPGTSCTASWW